MKRKLTAVFILLLTLALLTSCSEAKENNEVISTESEILTNDLTEEEILPEVNTEVAEQEQEAEEASTAEVQELTEEVVEEENATYTYTDMSATMYAKSTVNVRDLPSTDGNKIGSLSTNDEVHVTGQCNETNWYRFELNGEVAYVSNSYLVNEKVEVAPPAETPNNGGNNSGTPICYSWPSDTIVYENGMGFICGEINRHNTDLYISLEAEMRAKYPKESSTPREWYGNGYAFQLSDGRWYYPVGPYYLAPDTSVYKESVRLFGN